MSVAEVRVLLGQLDQAEAMLLEGLERGLGRERMRRQLSEVQFRIYLESIKKLDNGEFSADLALLEKAATTDSSNPNISAGVARLIALKIKPTDLLLDILKQQIKSGTTTVATHLSLGEGYFGIGRIEEAQKHWELALQGDPNSVVGLNNLALSLAQLQPPNLQRALELASRAHAIAPQNPSVLDTFGEILLIADRPKEAVNKLELAIRYDNARIGTRKKLVIAYQASGLNDMAIAQSAVIEQIESANKGQEPQSQKRDND
jgi:tetratricopeptide (TPR) repeat protein